MAKFGLHGQGEAGVPRLYAIFDGEELVTRYALGDNGCFGLLEAIFWTFRSSISAATLARADIVDHDAA